MRTSTVNCEFRAKMRGVCQGNFTHRTQVASCLQELEVGYRRQAAQVLASISPLRRYLKLEAKINFGMR